jgi:hypothetical protein
MSEQPLSSPGFPGPDEKSAQVMLYLRNNICWGSIVIKQAVRVTTWLRTIAAPNSITIFNGKVLSTTAPGFKPIVLPEIYIVVPEILVFHLLPPDSDPLDYDPTEPNRHMDAMTAMVANFRIDGFMRMAGKSTLGKYIEVTREIFSSVYDADISCPTNPTLGIMHVPYVLVRQAATIFANRQIQT